jgi:hypothetical protein
VTLFYDSDDNITATITVSGGAGGCCGDSASGASGAIGTTHQGTSPFETTVTVGSETTI